MKLVLYSGGQSRANHRLHAALVELAISARRPPRTLRMTYVPFCSDGSAEYFARFVRRYESFGVNDFHLLKHDSQPSRRDIARAFSGDIIYLAGGNTYYFLKHLREAGLLPRLRAFARSGGVLAGLSAGALIMTPTIRLAGIPEHTADDNEVALRDLRGLGLVGFELHSHYKRGSKLERRALIAYSRKNAHPIYAVPDGGGIVINGGEVTTTESVDVFHRGEMFRLGI